MEPMINRDIGKHEAEIHQLKNDMREVKQDLHEIKDILSQAKGGWKTLLLVAGMSGAIGAFIGKFSPWLIK